MYVQLSALVRAAGGNTGEIGYQRLAELFGVSVQTDDVLLPKLDQLIAACGWTEALNGNGEKVVQISRNANYEVIASL